MAVALQLVPVGQHQVLQVFYVAHVVQGEVSLDLQVLGAGGVGGALLVPGALNAPDGAAQAANHFCLVQLVHISQHDGTGAVVSAVVVDALQGVLYPVGWGLLAAVFAAPPCKDLARAAGRLQVALCVGLHALHKGFVGAVLQGQQALGLGFAKAVAQLQNAAAKGLGHFGVNAITERHGSRVGVRFQQLGNGGFAGVVVAGNA